MTEFLKDNKNRNSNGRLMVSIAVITAVCLAIVTIVYKFLHTDQSISEFIALIGTFLTFAGGLKVGQKFAEAKEQ